MPELLFSPPPLDSLEPEDDKRFVPPPLDSLEPEWGAPEGSPEYAATLARDLNPDGMQEPPMPTTFAEWRKEGGTLGALMMPNKVTQAFSELGVPDLPEATSVPGRIAKTVAQFPGQVADFLTSPEGAALVAGSAVSGPVALATTLGFTADQIDKLINAGTLEEVVSNTLGLATLGVGVPAYMKGRAAAKPASKPIPKPETIKGGEENASNQTQSRETRIETPTVGEVIEQPSRDAPPGRVSDNQGAAQGEVAAGAPTVNVPPVAERAPEPALEVRDPSENVTDVMDATFESKAGARIETVPIDSLNGGTVAQAIETKRVDSLARKMQAPGGYISRLIVDAEGNVVEGQHRLEALRKIGVKEVPVVRIFGAEDFIPDVTKLKSVLEEAGLRRDHRNQMVSQLGEILLDEKGDVSALRDYDPPEGFEKAWAGAVDEVVRQKAPAAGAADGIMSPGPGAASAMEPLASYEQRSFGERFQADQSIAQEIRDATGNRYYEPIRNKDTVEAALQEVQSRPITETINMVQDPASGLAMHTRVAIGQLVIKRLNKALETLEKDDPRAAETVMNQVVSTAEWLDQYGTELGQGVQQYSAWQRLTPEGKLVSLARTVRKARDRFTSEHGAEVGQVIETITREGLTDAERLAELRKLFKTNATARKVRPNIEKLIETARTGKLTDQTFYEIAGDRLGLPKWDPKIAAEIMRLAQKVDAATEGIPRDRAQADLAAFIARQKGFDARDVPIGIYYGNMLSGYNTHIVNALDTFGNVMSEVTGMAMANPRAAAKIFSNTLRGFLEGRTDFLQALSTGRMVTDGKWLEVPKLMEVAEFGKKGGVPINVKTRGDAVIKAIAESRPAYILNGWKYVTRLMSASDAVMFRGAKEGRLALLADRVARNEGLTGRALDKRVEEIMGTSRERTETYQAQAVREGFTGHDLQSRVMELREMERAGDLRADANEFAGLATYNHEPQGWLGYAANGIGRASTKYPLLKLFVPFTRIVANVTNRGLNYTPLGFKRAFYGYERGAPLTGDARAAMLARATIGTAGVGALLGMQAAGLIEINGAGPSDPQHRQQLEAAGWKPYSLKIGDKYWSYVYTPIGLFTAILGNMSDSYRYQEMDQKDATTRGVYAVSRIGSTVFSQSFLSGLSNLFNALGKPEQAVSALKNIAASTAGAISTPRILLDIQRIFDPTKYHSDTLAGDLLRNTPFAVLVNKPGLNAFGERLTNPTNRFVSELKADPVWQLVVKKNLRVSVPDKSTDLPDGKGGKRRITPEEYYFYLEQSGKQLHEFMRLNLDTLRGIDDEAAQRAISRQAENIRGRWLRELRIQAGRQGAQ